jgi:hypothetical protein
MHPTQQTSTPHQLKNGIIPRNSPKRLHRRARLHWKKLPDRARISPQILPQNLRLSLIRNLPQTKSQPRTPALQRNLPSRLRIPHPLRAPPRRHQNLPAPKLHQIHRSRENLPALPPAHLQQVNERRSQPQPSQKPHRPIEKSLHRIRRLKLVLLFRSAQDSSLRSPLPRSYPTQSNYQSTTQIPINIWLIPCYASHMPPERPPHKPPSVSPAAPLTHPFFSAIYELPSAKLLSIDSLTNCRRRRE